MAGSPPRGLPPLRVPALTMSRPQHVQQPAPGGAKAGGRRGGGEGVSVLRCPQPDVLDVQLLAATWLGLGLELELG